MKIPLHAISLTLVFVCFVSVDAQRRKPGRTTRPSGAVTVSEAGKSAIVIDETLSVLRTRPSLFADPIQRMRRGRRVQILGSIDADGVRFYKVAVPPSNSGWVQSDAVARRLRPGDEERFARLVQASDGFDQIELAAQFCEMYPESEFRAPILLLFGDLLEDAASKLSRDATSRLSRREMVASGAPVHSYYLNFNMIDRYRKLGVTFLFNSTTRRFHYNGASWSEIVRRFGTSSEAIEAAKRLDALKLKMEKRDG